MNATSSPTSFSVSALQATWSRLAMSLEVRREATFAVSPMTVYSMRPFAPRKPATT